MVAQVEPHDDTLFRVRDLAVVRGERRLVQGFDLDLTAGEIVGVRGPSGSGKTSLLRTLALLDDPAAGDICLQGRTPEHLGWTTWRRHVGLAAQLPAVFPGTVRDNLARPFGFHGAEHDFDEPAARTLLDTLLLTDVALDAEPDHLSVGQQQRLCLARTLLLEPTVLLLDEPTSALDPDAATALEDEVRRRVTERRAAALIVSHDPGRADRWCDRIIDLGTRS